MNPNLKRDQIVSLVQRLQFRMKGEAKVPLKQKADLNNFAKASTPTTNFKSGGSLPSVDAGKENKSKTVVKFQDELEDDEDEGFGSDFDANELLDLKDYKNKREQLPAKVPQPVAKPIATPQAKTTVNATADEAWELSDDGDDGWGEDNLNDLKKFDYENTDLNKMSDY